MFFGKCNIYQELRLMSTFSSIPQCQKVHEAFFYPVSCTFFISIDSLVYYYSFIVYCILKPKRKAQTFHYLT